MDSVAVFDARRCALGEGPYFDDRTGRFGWVDILGSRVLWSRPADGSTGELSMPGHVGAAVPRRDGGLVVCLPAGPALLDPDGTVRALGSYSDADAEALGAAPPPGPALRSNDAKADRVGRLWVGTMAYDESPGAGALYRLDPGAPGPVRVFGDLTVSNGLGWSPDGTVMYYIDSPTGGVDAFDYDPDTGTLSGRRIFAMIDTGFPDGLCVDADGGVWVAIWLGSAVRRYRPDGRLDRVVPVPTPQVTSCAFGGDGFRTLVITTAAVDQPDDDAAGLTYAHIPGDVVGLPVDRYAG
ncbi:MAG TPA: SMP-30/gluconolactonase/LRE family protein [Micromonosporaceae bacterium]|nr:SMP-30/gluconolactonase/LRE family protein [Micromonosporaceae bacterium]